MKPLVIYEESKDLVHAIIGVAVGWRHEVKGKRGITHFLEHAVFLGNESHPSPDDEFGAYGVNPNGMTLPEHTLFYFTSTKRDFFEVWDLFMSLIFHPTFSEARLSREKTERIKPVVVQETDYTSWELAYEWAKNLVFQRDFRLSLGTDEDIASLTGKDLALWHRTYYHDSNCLAVVHGDVDENQLAERMETLEMSSESEIPSSVVTHWDKREVNLSRKDMRQRELVYGFKIPCYDVGWEMVRVLLGNYPISKLWEEPFTGITYMVESRLEWTRKGGGFFLYCGAKAEDTVHEVDRNVWSLLENFEVDEKQFAFAKKTRLLELLRMKEEGGAGLRRFFFVNSSLRYRNFYELIEAVERLQVDDILKLEERTLRRENAVRVMVGG